MAIPEEHYQIADFPLSSVLHSGITPSELDELLFDTLSPYHVPSTAIALDEGLWTARFPSEDRSNIQSQRPFHTACAWDERMEHAAKHRERASCGLDPATHFGGIDDPSLTNWAARPGIAIIVADFNKKYIRIPTQ
ncbi:hmg-i/hmg-y- DNA-binding protein [Apiospora sp. TS-2023a]